MARLDRGLLQSILCLFSSIHKKSNHIIVPLLSLPTVSTLIGISLLLVPEAIFYILPIHRLLELSGSPPPLLICSLFFHYTSTLFL